MLINHSFLPITLVEIYHLLFFYLIANDYKEGAYFRVS